MAGFSNRLGLPVAQGRGQLHHQTLPQYTLNKKEREENVQGAFGLRQGYAEQLASRTVVLVDDIYTTGATMNACADALKKAGPKKILAITLASGRNL